MLFDSAVKIDRCYSSRTTSPCDFSTGREPPDVVPDWDRLSAILAKVTNHRHERAAGLPPVDRETLLSGRLLLCTPSYSMYDGLASECTQGLFSSDSIIAPLFWVSLIEYQGERHILAYVPKPLLRMVEDAIRVDNGGAIRWLFSGL